MGVRTGFLALAMLVWAPAGDAIAQQRAPTKPTRESPKREEPKPPSPEQPAKDPQSCCRVCSKGKACGNSCINRQLMCHKPPGCACNAGPS